MSVEGDWPSYTMDATVVVTYRTDEGVLRAVRKIGQIPIKATLRSCPPEKSSSFVTVINAPSILPFTQLFPGIMTIKNFQRNFSSQGSRKDRFPIGEI